MVVKSQLKRIRSLQQKKYRNELGLFFVEGKKTVLELLNSDLKPYEIYSTDPETLNTPNAIFTKITSADLKQISLLKNPNGFLGVFYIPEPKEVDCSDWVIALDDIRDPGNLGTIIRLCDWFGIQHLVCSKNTVDCYNPKVLQATMGSIARVNITYLDLPRFIVDAKVPVLGAFMDGDVVYQTKLPKTGILVLGNEANGISSEIEKLISLKISIPQFGSKTTESLNVATATAILLSEVRRG